MLKILRNRHFCTIYTCDLHYSAAIPDPHIAPNQFIKSFNAVAGKHAPFKKLRIKSWANRWVSPEISELLKVRDFG